MDTTDIERKRSYCDMRALEDFKSIDQARYCRAVFNSDDDQIEDTIETALMEEAQQYDLTIPEQGTAKSATPGTPKDPTPSNTTTAVTTTSSTARNSISGHDAYIDNLAVSLSGTTMSSLDETMKPDSLGSITSISTRPTSYSSNEGKVAVALDQTPKQPGHGHSRSSSLMNDRRLMQGLKLAFGKFPPLRKRKNGLVVAAATRASLEVENEKNSKVDNEPEEPKPPAPTQEEKPTMEPTPTVDTAAVLRSKENGELIRLQSSQTELRDRHILFEKEILDALREHHRCVQEERRLQHVRAEKENHEQVKTMPAMTPNLMPCHIPDPHILYAEQRGRNETGRTSSIGGAITFRRLRTRETVLPYSHQTYGSVLYYADPTSNPAVRHKPVR